MYISCCILRCLGTQPLHLLSVCMGYLALHSDTKCVTCGNALAVYTIHGFSVCTAIVHDGSQAIYIHLNMSVSACCHSHTASPMH